jgi:hypothetical protein
MKAESANRAAQTLRRKSCGQVERRHGGFLDKKIFLLNDEERIP